MSDETREPPFSREQGIAEARMVAEQTRAAGGSDEDVENTYEEMIDKLERRGVIPKAPDNEPRCDCGHLFEICGAPDKCW